MALKEILSIKGLKTVLFTLFMASFGFGIILPILPFYALSLGAKPFELGILTAVFAFASLIFAPIMGKLSDKIGRKKILLIGTTGFVLSYIILAFSNSLETLFIARFLEGISAATTMPACISLLSDLTSEKQRGQAMGMVGMAFSLGFIIGPAFGGIASAISIKDAFLLAALLALANFTSILLRLKEPKIETKNLIGAEISILQHIKSPLLFLFLSTFMTTFMIGGLSATLAIYTGDKLGFTSVQVGLIFTYIGVMILFMQFIGGKMVNKFGETRLIQAGLLLSGAGFLLLVFAHDWISLLFPLAIFVAGNAMVFPSVSSLLTKKVLGKKGAILGLENSFRSLGEMTGPILGGYLYSLNHDYSFIGQAIIIWLYFIIFTAIGRKKLKS